MTGLVKSSGAARIETGRHLGVWRALANGTVRAGLRVNLLLHFFFFFFFL